MSGGESHVEGTTPFLRVVYHCDIVSYICFDNMFDCTLHSSFWPYSDKDGVASIGHSAYQVQ